MFLAKFQIEDKEYCYIYCNDKYGWDQFHKDTFSPLTKNIKLLLFKIKGKTYQEKKGNAEELAKDWQHNFSSLNWSYGELAEINNYFVRIGKRYGLLKIFKENCIC